MNRTWTVHKFGGTSVGNADRLRRVASLVVAENEGNKAVVVSAMAGVTDSLIQLTNLANARDDAYLACWKDLKQRHSEVVKTIFPSNQARPLLDLLESDFNDIKEILRGVYLSRGASEGITELISGYGELWSSQFLNAHFEALGTSSTWLDARTVLFCQPGNSIAIDWARSERAITEWLSTLRTHIVVVPGFVASAADGTPTTLKRNGSDYSASIFGKLLKAERITIWTDVDGILSADPRLVSEAIVLPEVSYEEATELAFFGAKVVHPSTMRPAMELNIPIWIRNAFNPSHPGTKIREKVGNGHIVKGFATIEEIALINVQGTGMMGIPGVASRLFSALREVGVSVILISQASSEHSICFAIAKAQAATTRATLERVFFGELHHREIEVIDVTENCSIVAVVGDNMVDHPGVAGKFFAALGRARVNVRAIAQGSSERNISAVIDAADSRRALRSVHSAFYLSNQTISIGVAGTGLIGGAFLDQLTAQREILKREFKIDLRVRGLLDSKRMVLHESTKPLTNWRDALNGGAERNLDSFVDHIQSDTLPHAAIVDCTASADLPQNYVSWLMRGIHIITPNKRANTGTMEFYKRLQSTARLENRHYLYETTVGAGLPIISTLRDLTQTGDNIRSIEGVLSGTLSYIFNTFDGHKPFSEVVQEARRNGYTEPDPRDDLSGVDVARKLVILAREMGMEIELGEVEIESLVPTTLRNVSLTQFNEQLSDSDSVMTKRLEEASKQGHVLRYVGTLDPASGCSVALKTFPRSHPFAGTRGNDNIVVFTTRRYNQQPLIVQGPGAGPDVTAGGVFADLLRLASYVGGSA